MDPGEHFRHVGAHHPAHAHTAPSGGATTSHVMIEVSPTVSITASIANEAAEELGVKPGMQAIAVIKASDVMVGV
ncbi:MAG TPA: TOBE domain-containing protein [Rhodopila sp.]